MRNNSEIEENRRPSFFEAFTDYMKVMLPDFYTIYHFDLDTDDVNSLSEFNIDDPKCKCDFCDIYDKGQHLIESYYNWLHTFFVKTKQM